jgi:hypothetical protein
MTEPRKLCIDCKWHGQFNGSSFKRHYCAAPNNLSLVDGAPYIECSSARFSASHCGEGASNFEPKA